MFVADLFEAKINKVLVIMPGGFHPPHRGHKALYDAAVKAFRGADVYAVTTNDTKERPFPFELKQELAQLAGFPADKFVQVKSPFQAKEIISQYDPNTTAVVFVRSEKDRGEQPQAGGTKKDGSPSYFQPLSQRLEPLAKHGYLAYLPTVEFRAGRGGVTSASQIRAMWPKSSAEGKQKIVQDLYPAVKNPAAIVAKLDQVLGGISEDSASLHDYRRPEMLRLARRAHPLAQSDEEALALYVADKEKADVKRIDQTNDWEDRMISRLMDLENSLEQQVSELQQQINDLKIRGSERKSMHEAAAVGAIATRKQASDPRYSTSLTKDVRPGQINKNLKAFNLAEKK